MPVSQYFNQHASAAEQKLVNDLAIETIKVNGVNTYYVPRTYGDIDPIFREDDQSSYDSAYTVEMYVKDPDLGFGGMGEFLTDQLEIRDTLTLVVAMQSWKHQVGDIIDKTRPLEGDLIFFPFNKKLFKINFVEHESVFYQSGALYVWELRTALFRYSGEIINTGIPEIDALDDTYSLGIDDRGLMLEDGLGAVLEEQLGVPIELEDQTSLDSVLDAQNDQFQVEADVIIDWSCIDPLVRYPTGKF